MKRIITLLILLFTFSIKAENKYVIYSEISSFNKSFPDNEYPGESASFATLMTTLGGYYRHENEAGSIIGGGFVQSEISEGKVDNIYNKVNQEYLRILTPYVFIGQNFGFWELELGLTNYLTYQKYGEREYYNPDGTIKTIKKSGTYLNRQKSYVFPNFKLRLFNKDWIHIEFKYARGMYSIYDSLVNVSLCYPRLSNYFEISFALKTINDYFSDEENIMKSNQKLYFSYQYNLKPWIIGTNFGFLIKNAVGSYIDKKGESAGTASFLNRFSLGLNISLEY